MHLLRNIFYMLSYAYTPLKNNGYKNVDSEDFKNVEDMFAGFITEYFSHVLKRGMYKEYIEKSEDLNVVRGKVNIAKTINPKLIMNNRIHCEYDELSENNGINQIFKKTLRILLLNDISNERKKDIKRLLPYFKNVDEVVVHCLNFNITFNRLNKMYEYPINICKFIINNLIPNTDDGKNKILDLYESHKALATLYENFLREYYRKEHGVDLYIHSRGKEITWMDVNAKNYKQLPNMISDVYIKNEHTKKILIIDAKYYSKNLESKDGGELKIFSQNIYQVFTYVKNEAFKMKGYEVSGLLLYAQTDLENQPHEEYQFDNNKIWTDTVNLKDSFINIRSKLDSLIDTVLLK